MELTTTRSFLLRTLSLILSVISLTQAYNCYRPTDKASKPLNLAQHSAMTSNEAQSRRRKRDVESNDEQVLVFDIGNYIHLREMDRRVISDDFSISMWLYMEGGQPDRGSILALKNKCFGYSPWSLRLSPAEADTEMRSTFTFSVEDVYRQRKVVTMETYEHHEWFHMAVVNDVDQMKLYINGVRVSTGEGMAWTEFTDLECLKLEVGHQIRGFRGKLKHLQIFESALSARKIKQIESDLVDVSSLGWLDDTFTDLSTHWISGSFPNPVQEWTTQKKAQTISAPPCGKTVCDDPSVVKSYETKPELKSKKVVTLEVLVPAYDDGTGQLISAKQISDLSVFMNKSFAFSNIEWKLETRLIQNDTIRRSLVMFDCRPEQIGDGRCDNSRTCNLASFPETNFDGLDCKWDVSQKCRNSMLGDGVCDPECNTGSYELYYDYGDCCIDPEGLCISPNNVNRTLYHLSEIQESFRSTDDKLRFVVVNFLNSEAMLGVASMPWEQHGDVSFGSVIVDASTLQNPLYLDTAVHEIGHMLGLWHVHHGVSELDCSDQCVEREASLELGDLCADTAPTAMHTECADPDPVSSTCAIPQALTNTPYSNFMSYANGSCSADKTFTPQQIARMHCYLDLVHSNAVTDPKPSAIPLPLQILAADSNSVTLSWLPPLASGQSKAVCAQCGADATLTQYAITATMSGADKYQRELFYGPEHATGYPDAAPCKQNIEVWSPQKYYFKLRSQGYQFNFTFEHAVKPHSVKIWLPWFKVTEPGVSPIKEIRLVSVDDEVVKRITKVPIQCDKPFTREVDVQVSINKVVIYTQTPNIDIDAVELTSAPESGVCGVCDPRKYRITRDPPFEDETITTETVFEDVSVDEGVEYTYTVTGVVGSVTGVTSPALHYIHNQQFCGNGQLDGEEECDDGNFITDDGCTPRCKLEPGYKCVGTPSVCWKEEEKKGKHCGYRFTHEEDGCGFYVPHGYTDQWASTVSLLGRHLTCSPSHLLLGPPSSDLQCQATLSELSPPVWQPCQIMYFSNDYYILKFGFEKAVVVTEVIIHIGSDGGSPDNTNTIAVSQVYEQSSVKEKINTAWRVSCKDNPISVTVEHDLSKPFQRTEELRLQLYNRKIAIAAVRVRTFENFDPVTINSCRSNLYNTGTNQCAGPVEAKSCPPMEIIDGNITCTGMSEGDSCNVFCEEGYAANTISGSSTCIDGRWTPALSCTMVSCDRPDIPLGYATCENGHHFNSVCEMSCSAPSQLLGNGTLIKCLESGIWTEPRAWCSPVCPALSDLNAVVSDERCEGPQDVYTRCSFTCAPGYYMEGQDMKQRQGKAECLETAEWNTQCVRVQCSAPLPVWAGLYNCTDGLNSGTVCSATCPSTQITSVIACSAVGQWNASFATCDMSDTSCPRIEATRVGMNITCNGDKTGSVCRLKCKDHSQTVHQQTVEGNEVKMRQFRQKLRCTSLGQWSPSLDDLYCAQLCNEEYIGDGWCDATNNRALCNWDGGDCCTSTTKALVVQNFPESCTTDCNCVDPEAVENRPDLNAGRWWRVRNGYAVDRRH